MKSIEAILRAEFPDQPLPVTFFLATDDFQQDIQKELAARIQGRIWTTLSMLDWRLVGAHPSVCREYIIPATFTYYVPSLLVGVISDPGFRDWAFEAILPSNRQRRSKDDWWASYVEAFTDRQRAAIKSFLAYQRGAERTLDVVEEELLSAAEAVWR